VHQVKQIPQGAQLKKKRVSQVIVPEQIGPSLEHVEKLSAFSRLRQRALSHPGPLLLIVIFFTQLLGPIARYCPIGFLDSWIYTSYFVDWPDMVRRYGQFYYGTRVPYIALGALFYKIFAPHVANFLINITLIWMTCYAVYRILRHFYTPAPCLIYALALSVNVGLLQPVLWDYPDGPAIAYGFFGLWFAFAPPFWARGLMSTFIAGALYACSGHTMMIMGLVIMPAILAQIAFEWHDGIKKLVVQVATLVAGAVVCTAFFGLISLMVGGRFMFFWPQILQARWTLSNGNYSNWAQPVSVWLPHAYRLLIPVGALVIASLRLVAGKGLHDAGTAMLRASTLFLIGCSGLYAYFGLLKNALVLQVFYSSVFLLIPSLLCLGLLFCTCWQSLTGLNYRRVAGIALIFVFLLFVGGAFAYSYEKVHGPFLLMLCSIVAIALASLGMLFSKKFSLTLRILVSGALLITSDVPLLAESSIAGPVFEEQAPGFDVALHVRQLINFVPSEGKTVRFWFDKNEKQLPLFDSIASLYTWGSPSQTVELIDGTEQQRRSVASPNTLLVLMSSDPQKIEQDEALLRKYGVVFERQGLTRVLRRPYDFYVNLLSIVR
jgi:hypothetical protein